MRTGLEKIQKNLIKEIEDHLLNIIEGTNAKIDFEEMEIDVDDISVKIELASDKALLVENDTVDILTFSGLHGSKNPSWWTTHDPKELELILKRFEDFGYKVNRRN